MKLLHRRRRRWHSVPYRDYKKFRKHRDGVEVQHQFS